jgi:SAM-dependent methyltransferase
MVQGQRAEDRNPDRYKIVDGVSGDVEGRDVVSHEVERALGQGVDEQAFLGSEEAVDGPRRRAGLCGDGSHGECSGSAVGNERYFVPAIGRPLADALPFPDGAFDLVLCQLGLQFFPDRLGALREMRRVLAPSGRTLVSSRGRHPRSSPSSRTPWQRPSPPDVAAFVRVVFSLHEPDELRGLVADAGFRRSDARGHSKTLRLPSPEEFLWQYVSSTPLATAVAVLDGHARAAVTQDVVASWQPFTQQGRLILELDFSVPSGEK